MRTRGFDLLWLIAFGIASSAWCLSAAQKLGATFDEPFYLNAGLTSWRTGSNKLMMSAGTMPLPVDVQTLPVYLWERTRGEEFHAYQDIATILPVARAANLAFWWMLLVYAMRLGRTWGGAWGGRLAVALCALEPNFLAHAALATTDIPLVASVLALVYHGHHGQGMGWARRVLIPGIAYGVAILAKASGMVFGMQALLVLGLWHLAAAGALTAPANSSYLGRIRHLWHATFQLRKDLTWIAAIGFMLTFAWTGSDWGTEHTFVEWAEQQPPGPLRDIMVPLSNNLRIFPNAGEALLQQVKHNFRGHGAFILGEWHPKAWWAYFPVALSVKTPAPVLALLVAVLLIRPRALVSPLGAFALVLFLFSLNCRVQIGIRFMFTLMAVANIALGVAIARSWSDPGRGRYVPRWFVAAMLVAMAAITTWIWPHGLSFVNQLWGGVQDGYLRLSDSNYDWGQGLPELKQWNEEHNAGQPIAVSYFGTDPTILFAPFKWIDFYHHLQTGSPEELRRVAGTKYLAVSTSALYGMETQRKSHMAVIHRLRQQTPIGRTQTFFIYAIE
jgi:hypothetical protein